MLSNGIKKNLNFGILNKFFKYLNVVLILVFVWVTVPVSIMHDVFANHEDTDQTECLLYHKHLGTHIEKRHNHCGLFNINSPLYDAPKIVNLVEPIQTLVCELSSPLTAPYNSSVNYTLPPRGPPALA